MESLSKLEDMKPSLLYPGHGPMVTNGVAKIQQYISHRMERERQVCENVLFFFVFFLLFFFYTKLTNVIKMKGTVTRANMRDFESKMAKRHTNKQTFI